MTDYKVFFEFVKKALAGEPGDTSADKIAKIKSAVEIYEMMPNEEK